MSMTITKEKVRESKKESYDIYDYIALLKRAKQSLPKIAEAKQRFEIPKVRGHIEGNKTIVSNFMHIVKVLHSKPEHVLKFLQRELATPGEIKQDMLILGSKVAASRLNNKINLYAKMYVICKECHKPDTELIKEHGVLMIKCHACGAKHSVRGI